MAADPAALDQVFAKQGGFNAAYKKLVALAQAMLVTYGGDSRSRVALRQLDPEEIVNIAFERYFTEGAEEGANVYFVLRNHVRNFVRSAAKSAKEKKTIRVDGDEKKTALYEAQVDPTGMGAEERLSVIDDFDFCKKMMFRVLADCKGDKDVEAICEAIIAGFREHADIAEYAKLDKAAFDAAFKRLKRRFVHALMAADGDLKK